LRELDDFVSGGEDGGGGLAEDLDGFAAEGGEGGDAGVIQAGAGVEDDLAGGGFAGAGVDELPGLGEAVDANAGACAMRMFHHHDGVGAGGMGARS